jgi:hypothetical protein
MNRLILTLMLAAACLPAQQLDPNENIQKIVNLKYADPISIQSLLRTFGINISVDERMRVIVLSGERRRVTSAEDAIKQLDVPGAAQKDIELTVYFVTAGDALSNSSVTAPIPADLQSTIATLKSTFPFKNYVLLDVLSLRSRSGMGAETSGSLGSGRYTHFNVRSASLEPDGNIRLDHLSAGVRIPTTIGTGANAKSQYNDAGVSTDVVDVKEGQKLVVGRASLDGPEKAMFLVLIAKVAN